ncbi:DUF6263 family protein [Gaoshiqia sp. Z1-71]|uniref:DUF6263 family protein n=1 Tax=Gaoshiqia hydrogeniformans TaxID=3290090 RepID=UPI003BF7996F
MKTKLYTLITCAIFLLINTFTAQSKVLLRLNLEKGATYEMTMVMSNKIDQEMMGQNVKIDQNMEMLLSYLVLEVLPNNNFLVEYSLPKMSMKMKVNGQEMNFDSEDTAEDNPVNQSLKELNLFKMQFELTPKGTVERISGFDEYAEKISGNQLLQQSMQMFTNEGNFESFISQTFNYFPENEVGPGDKWTASFHLPAIMNMETIMNFEVVSIENDRINLNVTSDINMDTPIEQGEMKMNMKMSGSQQGNMVINTGDGWLRDSDLVQKFDMNMKMKNPQSGEDLEIPMQMNSIAKISVIKK